jgi:hypothetical protein
MCITSLLGIFLTAFFNLKDNQFSICLPCLYTLINSNITSLRWVYCTMKFHFRMF